MIPAAFDYARPATLDEALGLLAKHGEEAKLLRDPVLLDAEDRARAAHADKDARHGAAARFVGDGGNEILRFLDGLAADHLRAQASVHAGEVIAHRAILLR